MRRKEKKNLEALLVRTTARPNIVCAKINVVYHENGFHGELDLDALTKGGTARYYEYKCWDTPSARQRAEYQFRRYYAAYKKKAVCVYVAGPINGCFVTKIYRRTDLLPF